MNKFETEVKTNIELFLKSMVVPKDYDLIVSADPNYLLMSVYNPLYNYKSYIDELFEMNIIEDKERKYEKLISLVVLKNLGMEKVRFRKEYNMTPDDKFICKFP